MKLSVVIIAYNEEDRISSTLKSAKRIADEIIVIDSFSNDRTVEISESFGAKVFKNEFNDYSNQKNLANQKASYELVLNLDADEVLSDELIDEINRIKSYDVSEYTAYYVNRKNYYLGKWIKHSGWYPDKKLRLFLKSKVKWVGRVHERLEVNGKIGRLKGDLIHHTYRDIYDHIYKLNRYSSFQAIDIAESNMKILLIRALIMPIFSFLRNYVLKLGFIDGFAGLLIALVSSWAVSMKYLKAIEIRNNGKK